MAASGPTLDQLKNRLTQLLRVASDFAVTVYRSSTPRYATESDLLTGAGSKMHGGRWNPVGIAVVYNSLTPETAMAETLAQSRYFGIPIEESMPRVFVATVVNLHSVLDLRQGLVRQRLQVSQDRILAVDWRKEVHAGRVPITQLIGQAAAEIGLEGLIVPSAADHKGHNLLVFPENLATSSSATVLHAERLSK
jgi:RES domain-containing protein